MLKNVFISFLGFVALPTLASAATLDFTGGYRLELHSIDSTSLATPKGQKSYLTNYLYLMPRFVAADGVEVVTRFDVVTDGSVYENTYIGSLIGGNSQFGVNNPQGTVFGGNKGNLEMKASQLYLKINQEYGQILLGRAPFEFGVGMTYSAGNGEFDHFYHNRDMFAYKIQVGDVVMMPVLTRTDDVDFAQGQSSNSTGFLLQYENKDARSVIGAFKEDQKGTASTNSFPTFGKTIATRTDWNVSRTSVFLSRGWDFMNFRLEGGFVEGATGLIEQATSKEIELNAYGFAMELDFPRPESKWSYSAKLGIASGDDPSTTAYEGYIFSKNYDVGMLLFNHRLGQYDIFGTSPAKSSALNNSQSADDEALSNAYFVAPKVSYVVNDRLTWNNTLVFAQILNNAQNSLASAKDLGLEWDTELVYKYNSNVTWVNQLGVLMPGKAWKYGSNTEYENATTFGFASKAAISF